MSAGLDSDFLFVTRAFDCTATVLAVALGKGFALDDATAVLVPAFDAALAVPFGALLEVFSTSTLVLAAFVLLAGGAAGVFLTADATGFGAAGFAVLANTEELGVFAGFFITLAMESLTN
ncbi:MAG TPA: hypothetical protein VJ577_06165 [Burkholderiaceae bacterium]|nr:hypothetical protein [Burkholderiaceae bacterium]